MSSFINMHVQIFLFFILVVTFADHTSAQNVTQAIDLFVNLTDKMPSLHLVSRGGKSYYIGDVFKGNFFHAEQFCRYHGMSLVNIESQEENDFLQDKILENGDSELHFWNSGTKLPDKQRWISFTTARAMTYFNWGPGEPNNPKKDENCVEMRFVDKLLKWNNILCDHDFNFICELTWTQDCQKLYNLLEKNEMNLHNLTDLIDIRIGVPAE